MDFELFYKLFFNMIYLDYASYSTMILFFTDAFGSTYALAKFEYKRVAVVSLSGLGGVIDKNI